MFDVILSRANLNCAWDKVKANGGAAGVDGVTIEDFVECMREQWPRIKQEILNEISSEEDRDTKTPVQCLVRP